jgi:hypothetical protein
VDADRLFLARCKQIETAMQSTNEIELLDLSAHLRQLLIDDTAPHSKSGATFEAEICGE